MAQDDKQSSIMIEVIMTALNFFFFFFFFYFSQLDILFFFTITFHKYKKAFFINIALKSVSVRNICIHLFKGDNKKNLGFNTFINLIKPTFLSVFLNKQIVTFFT